MSLLRLPTPGLDLQSTLSIAQEAITLAGGSLANAGNILTVTTPAAHGLTFSPSAGVPPNYFVTFAGTSAPTGTGVLNGNVFRILSIPSTTTFTIYSTVTGATLTSSTVIPVFFPPFTAQGGSAFAGGPSQVISSVTTYFPPADLEGAYVYALLAANCTCQIDLDQTALILDSQSTPSSGTPATAPNWTAFIPASSNNSAWLAPPWGAIWASAASAGTSKLAVVN